MRARSCQTPRAALEPLGGAVLGGPILGSPVCGERSRYSGKDCSAPHPPMAGGPHHCSTLWDQGFYVELSLGPTSPPCPTWWSLAFRDPRLTHEDPTPHLASIWGWPSQGWRGGHIWLGNWRIPRGPVTPREGSVSLCNTTPCTAAGLCLAPWSSGQCWRMGSSLSQPPPPTASQPQPGTCHPPGSPGGPPFGGHPTGRSLTC